MTRACISVTMRFFMAGSARANTTLLDRPAIWKNISRSTLSFFSVTPGPSDARSAALGVAPALPGNSTWNAARSMSSEIGYWSWFVIALYVLIPSSMSNHTASNLLICVDLSRCMNPSLSMDDGSSPPAMCLGEFSIMIARSLSSVRLHRSAVSM